MQNAELTLKEAFELYLQKQALADSSVVVKTRAVKHFIEAMGDLPIQSITYKEAEDFKVWLIKTKPPNYDEFNNKKRTKKTANIYLANIKPVFSWLLKRGYISQNPFDGIDRFRTDKRRKEIFEPIEIERILRVADLRWKAIVLLGLCTLRRTEVLNLIINDLHFKEGYLHISRKTDGQFTWRWDTKNYQEAIVPMPKMIMLPSGAVNLHQILKNLIVALKVQYPRQPYICVPPEIYSKIMAMQKEGYLDWEWRNCPWSNFNRDWKQLLKKAKVINRRFHDLRGTFPTMMAQKGVPMTDVQRLMRHSSIQTTAEYYISVDENKLIGQVTRIAGQFYKKGER